MEKLRFSFNEQEFRCVAAVLSNIYKSELPAIPMPYAVLLRLHIKEIIKRMAQKHFDLHPKKNILSLSATEALALYWAALPIVAGLKPWTQTVIQSMIDRINKVIVTHGLQ
jgi:hypothetical protein